MEISRWGAVKIIDIESDIFNDVANALRTAYPEVNVYGDYSVTPSKFPCVFLTEIDNRILQRMRTNNIENAVQCTYEANVYSNKPSQKKTEAKAIANAIDVIFNELGFTRTFRQQIPNVNDATIYRIVCRYEAVIDKNLVIYHSE